MKVLIFLCIVAAAFAAEEEEQKSCLEEPDSGMCRANFEMYYFDYKEQKCKTFVYGGCMGNGNRYPSEEACMKNCEGIKKQESGSSSCFLPAETGLCRGFFPRYFYDGVSGRCEKFIYGGCGGNENNFKTEEECMKRCAAYAPEACLEDKVTGLCDAYFPRYYFNKESGQCERFVYGGCGGNSNNFESKEDCEAVCQ